MNQTTFSSDYISKAAEQFSSTTEEQLLRAIAGGDERAFTELYRRYSQSLYNYLLRLMHDPAGAEDVLQEVFLAIWQGASGYRGSASVKTWVYRISHHRAVSWIRQHRRMAAYDDDAEPSGDAGPEDVTVGAWQHDDIRWALRRLSPKHRAVLELVFEQSLSYIEIAHVLNIPLGTIKSRMSYALRALNGLLKGKRMLDKPEDQAEE